MVIFGAGATHDSAAYFPASANAVPWGERPALADDLFDSREAFQLGKDHFPQFAPIIPQLIHRDPDTTVEQVLRRNLDEAAKYPPLYQQLAAVRYYLQWIMKHSIGEWYENKARRASNYAALIHQIRQAHHSSGSRDPICLVTFNYDLLIEKALGREFQSIDDYVNDTTFKLLKLHGSVNWARRVIYQSTTPTAPGDSMGQARLIISMAAGLPLSRDIEIADGTPPAAVAGQLLYPAIAIPVEQKSDFECPEKHMQLLRDLMPKVDKLLIVGWRATEAHFLNELRNGMRPGVDIVACCGSEDKAIATLDALRPLGFGSTYVPLKAGFSEMVANRKLDGFLASC